MDKDKQIAPRRNEITKWQEAYVEEFESPKTILVSEDEWKRVNEEVRRLEKELREAQRNFQSEQDRYAKQLKDAVRKLEKAEKPTYCIRLEIKYDRGDYVNLREYTYVDKDFEISPNALDEIRKYIATINVGLHVRLMELRDEIAYDLVKEITQRCKDYMSAHIPYTTVGFGPFKERVEDERFSRKISNILHYAIDLGALGINPSPDYKMHEVWHWGYWRNIREDVAPDAWDLESHRRLDWDGVKREIRELNKRYGGATEEQND